VSLTVVIATRNRREGLLATLARLTALPERPTIVVVDNASADGTPHAVRESFPSIEVVELRENRAAAARTIGVELAKTELVALSDDDSWWSPGSLMRAEGIFARHPRLGLAAARVLVGEEEDEDPTCSLMASSPLARGQLPGPRVLGFVACGAVVRRQAYLETGGFEPRFELACEEQLLAIELSRRGWELAYLPELVAHHYPSPLRNAARRRQLETRNALWLTWLIYRTSRATSESIRIAREALRDPARRRGLFNALGGLLWVLRRRSPVVGTLEQDLLLLDGFRGLGMPAQ
jgi:GT2 family glycosyltransferase